ncbi:alpha-1,6-glucosidase domain-containing protein [Undibacterium sp. SXout11W]|uniref:alpha-1,6-glucosidase domain-containing protein n=1 Tax=Undibacterium sp. SXout11W TaxID=3413050 RepID=UPI003BF397D3
MTFGNSACVVARAPHFSESFTTFGKKSLHPGVLIIALASLLTTHKAGATTLSTPSLADCNHAQYQTVLSKAVLDTSDARAYWLSSDTIRWPGKGTAGRFHLYASDKGGLSIRNGAKVKGATQHIDLQIGTGIRAAQSDIQTRFAFTGKGIELRYKHPTATLNQLLKQQVLLVQENDHGEVIDFTYIQIPGVLDDLYLAANTVNDLGAKVNQNASESVAQTEKLPNYSQFKVWAPTARKLAVCTYNNGDSKASAINRMKFESDTGIWEVRSNQNLSGHYYKYLLDVFIPGTGWVRNAVTDPYSVSLTTDSKRSFIANLNSKALKPKGWDEQSIPSRVQHATDMSVYELHVRDFSANDFSVRPEYRGKYLAFTENQSNGMRHIEALSKAGITDIHLLPVFDIATIPEANCSTPQISGDADSEHQQAIVTRHAATDCFNWGYDPFHYSAPEGSYATNAADGATRILEFRQMVMALHQANLRVGMDVVYNHTAYAGQHEKSVLDRIVPGYYQRLTTNGKVEESTCQTCGNTATENNMMAKLMSDSVRLWAREYKIDSFRFDLMGHQPRSVMEKLKASLANDNGRPIFLIGEGWNFGEVSNNARFVQATQLSLNGSGIGTFSDRARDAIRGASRDDDINSIVSNKGYINGLADGTTPQQAAQTLRAADMVRIGLAGTLSEFSMETAQGQPQKLKDINYNGQPAGYASEPDEVVNYVENHDNQTLFDINAFRLPMTTSHEDRARVQVLGLALTALSQGIAYFHAGSDMLRSKSLDGNSYNSGDWFNRLDWTYQDNYFGTGLPPKQDNQALYPLMRPLLVNVDIKPRPQDIAFTRDAFRDLLKIRSSSSLFHLTRSSEIKRRLHFYNTGPAQNPKVIVGFLDGDQLADANWKSVAYLINVSQTEQQVQIHELQHHRFQLHPVHLSPEAADQRINNEAKFSAQGGFTIPARSAVVFVTGD